MEMKMKWRWLNREMEKLGPNKQASIKPQQLHPNAVVCRAIRGNAIRFLDFTRDTGMRENFGDAFLRDAVRMSLGDCRGVSASRRGCWLRFHSLRRRNRLVS